MRTVTHCKLLVLCLTFGWALSAHPATAGTLTPEGQAPETLAERAARSGGGRVTSTPSPTATPMRASFQVATLPPVSAMPMPVLDQRFTAEWATVDAARILYSNDPTKQSRVQTEVYPTIEVLYTAYALQSTPTPTPVRPPSLPSSPVATDILRLLGIGAVIGLILGGLGGVIVGLMLSRWRE
jgi:hypothetical protein